MRVYYTPGTVGGDAKINRQTGFGYLRAPRERAVMGDFYLEAACEMMFQPLSSTKDSL